MDYVHDVAQVVFADLVERGEHAEGEIVREKVERVSAGHDNAGLGRHVGGSPRTPQTRRCPIGASELPQSRSKRRRDTHCTRRGDLYPSRRRVRDAVKVLRRHRGAADERASDVRPADRLR
jgi:hypothetical protein